MEVKNGKLRIFLTIFGIILLLACLHGIFFGDSSTTPSTASRATSTSAPKTTTAITSPTATSTPTPTATSTTIKPTNGPTVLGAPISNFFGKYGDPNVQTDHGYTWFFFDQNGNRLKWVHADYQPGGTVTQVGVVNASDRNWSLDESIAECSIFKPDGTKFEAWINNTTERFTSPVGEVQINVENDQGDCLIFFW